MLRSDDTSSILLVNTVSIYLQERRRKGNDSTTFMEFKRRFRISTKNRCYIFLRYLNQRLVSETGEKEGGGVRRYLEFMCPGNSLLITIGYIFIYFFFPVIPLSLPQETVSCKGKILPRNQLRALGLIEIPALPLQWHEIPKCLRVFFLKFIRLELRGFFYFYLKYEKTDKQRRGS